MGLTSLWIILRFYGEEFFPEQSSWWFCRKLSTLGTNITQHTSILMRPLVSESSKTSETPVSPIFQISKKQSQICQRLKTLSPNIEGKVTKESAKSHHLYWSFHCVQIEATARKGEILPFFTTAIKCNGVSSISSFRTWEIHPHFGLLWAPTKELESHSPFSCKSHPARASASSQSLESPCTSTSSSGDSPDAVSAIITDQQGKRLTKRGAKRKTRSSSDFAQIITTTLRTRCSQSMGANSSWAERQMRY